MILVKESLAEEMIARFSLNKVCYECLLHYTHGQLLYFVSTSFIILFKHSSVLWPHSHLVVMIINQSHSSVLCRAISRKIATVSLDVAEVKRDPTLMCCEYTMRELAFARNVNGIQCKAAANAETNCCC